MGVKVQYLALFRSGAELVQDHGPNSALTHMDRLPEYRIDAGANAVKTLRKHGVTAGGSLKLLLRPLHADHIHYAFSIYYKGGARGREHDPGPASAGSGQQYLETGR